jgi:uncharacterized protein YprB with RNaseH-like and TPR domain
MLEHTFIHIPGVGPKNERMLWDKGITTWYRFLEEKRGVFSPGRDGMIREFLLRSVEHRRDIRFFRDLLPKGEMWRLFKTFQQRSVYLDIETDGGYEGVHEITLIGIYDGERVQTFINGKNLQEFECVIADYDLVITFNGSLFDLPIIRSFFPGISLPTAHIDLRFVLAKLGYKGGLKHVEQRLGICRDPEIDGLNGYDAVLLWRAYEWGDAPSLDRLIRYNTADIMNLEPLMEMAYSALKEKLLKGP